MTFAFNFLPPEEGTTNANDDASPGSCESAGAKQTDFNASSGGSSADQQHPFQWVEQLENLLEERAKQEIVFQEVSLLKEDILSDVENEEKDPKTQSSKKPLRRVCMEQYQQEVTPGVYEGGLQVWECSLDLVRYFQQHNLRLTKGSALELGAGHALPGCWLLREALKDYQKEKKGDGKSAENSNNNANFTMTFVDFNDYVVKDATLSNIVLNTSDLLYADAARLARLNMVELGFGDWNDMSRKFKADGGRRFDWIMAAETTYTTEAAKDTAELLLNHLVVDTGIGWIASKRYYFGVGGGTDALREAAQLLSQNSGSSHYLKVETVWVVDNGVGNIREILKVNCHRKE